MVPPPSPEPPVGRSVSQGKWFTSQKRQAQPRAQPWSGSVLRVLGAPCPAVRSGAAVWGGGRTLRKVLRKRREASRDVRPEETLTVVPWNAASLPCSHSLPSPGLSFVSDLDTFCPGVAWRLRGTYAARPRGEPR